MGLEVVGLWVSVAAGFISITLATVAMLFTWRVHNQTHSLNQRFTEVLTSINEQSANTQGQISTMVSRVVETFLSVSTGSTAAPEVSLSEDGSESSLRDDISRLSRTIDEILLRQRLQAPSLTGVPRFVVGQKVRVVSRPQAPEQFWGLEGTVLRVDFRPAGNNYVVSFERNGSEERQNMVETILEPAD